MRSKLNGLAQFGIVVLVISLGVFIVSYMKEAELEKAYSLNGDMHYKGAQLINILSIVGLALGFVLLLGGLIRKEK